MLAPVSWLKDYTQIPTDVKAFASKMTMSGTKVEAIEYRGGCILNIVTARVESIEKHADSDNLWVCTLNDSESLKTVVTAAQNVTQGDIVPLARIGAVTAKGQTIEKTKLRGVVSEGMLCSGAELGLGGGVIPKYAQDGIYILNADVEPGLDIKDVLGLDDYVIDFELTNNRQDCNSMLGIACEASATLGKKFAFPDYEFAASENDIEKYLDVEIKNYALCPRYTAKMVEVIKIGPSPMWMQTRLMACGIRPINNIVDVSNYVMLETGQPLHTFDYHKLAGGKIIVDTAEKGDAIKTLDQTERALDESMLMINDAQKHAAIAGIMGGGTTDIDLETKIVVIEAAHFDKNSIRMTAKRLGLRTESSAHFEKGVSIFLTKYAADRAASLLVEIGAAKHIAGVIDRFEALPEAEQVTVNTKWLNGFIGISLSNTQICACLERLGFECRRAGDEVTARVPRFRSDIKIKEDVAEEVARMYGYDNIPQTLMDSSNFISEPNRDYEAKQSIKEILIGLGGFDTLTYAFTSPDAMAELKFGKDDVRRDPVRIINPLGEEYSVMRTTTVVGMLETLALNYNRKNKPELMFELANIYLKGETPEVLPVQKEMIALGKFGSDFYEIKGVVNALLAALKIGPAVFTRASEPFLHPGRSADISLDGEVIGFIGQLHPGLAKKYEICDETIVAQIDADAVIEKMRRVKIVSKILTRYPAAERDLAFVVNEETLASDIQNEILHAGGAYITACEVFDIYKSEALGAGKKSLAFNITFRSDERTLTDEEVDESVQNIITALERTGKAKLRQ